ncbi:MAG: hypothetical protein Q9211_004822 [Gyalolechia sp. 1 TL-2023]
MASSEAPVYQPKDAISASARTTMILGGAGLFLSAVENSLTRQNVTGWGVFTRTGGTIAMFAAIGGTFGFVRTAAANLREKDDAYNPAIAGFFAGGIVGLRMRSFPAVLGFGAVLAIIQGTHEYTGGKLSGYERDPSVDEYERKEQLRRNRRRPIEETLQELGEGRAYKNSTSSPAIPSALFLSTPLKGNLLHSLFAFSRFLGMALLSNMSDKDNFYRHVLQRSSELRERVYGLKSTELAAAARNTALTQCLTDINDLKNEIGSQANRTAPHDQRTYSEVKPLVLNGLNEQLQEVRSEIAPKRKFAFKPKASAAPINQSSAASPSPVESSRTRPVEEASETLDPQPVSTTGSGLGDSEVASAFSGIHHELRTESSLRHADRGIVMADSSQCVVRCALPSPKLTINNIQTSVLMSGPINGATFVTGMTASVLVVACRQLRMHRCRDCVVYLRCSSRPIIEDCSSIRFAPFPDELDIAPLDGTISDQWDRIHDFNWLKAGHSPNWSILEPEKRKSPDQWRRLQGITEGKVDEVLRELTSTDPNGQNIVSIQ